MFEGFDRTVLDSPEFKEDAVREEIIAPILRKLGYLPSGTTRVQRSKNLVHPFVRIGTRKHSVNIVPDYTLWHADKALLILDAKAPSEPILNSHNVEQAYSYAIHPEVRTRFYALCNGRRLVVFDVEEFDPLLNIAFEEFDSKWDEIEKHLSPSHLLNPELRTFQPDFGLLALKAGVGPDADIVFADCRLQLIARVSDELYTASSSCDLEGSLYLASFDFLPTLLDPMLTCLAAPLKAQLMEALSRAPYHAQVDFMVEVDLKTRLGPPTRGLHDTFVPFVITEVLASRFNRERPIREATDIPAHIFRLRNAFEKLQGR